VRRAVLLLALGACARNAPPDPAPSEDSAAADGDVDSDVDGDTDATTPTDTGAVAFLFHAGWFEMPEDAFSEAEMGVRYYGLRQDEFVCQVVGSLRPGGNAPACPDCDWAFDLGPVVDSVAEGQACDALGAADGGVDGMFDYTWGFATEWVEGAYTYENALLMYDGGWFVYQYGDTIVGDHASFAWVAGVHDEDGDYVAYAY
jgi:hypothetical protein